MSAEEVRSFILWCQAFSRDMLKNDVSQKVKVEHLGKAIKYLKHFNDNQRLPAPLEKHSDLFMWYVISTCLTGVVALPKDSDITTVLLEMVPRMAGLVVTVLPQMEKRDQTSFLKRSLAYVLGDVSQNAKIEQATIESLRTCIVPFWKWMATLDFAFEDLYLWISTVKLLNKEFSGKMGTVLSIMYEPLVSYFISITVNDFKNEDVTNLAECIMCLTLYLDDSCDELLGPLFDVMANFVVSSFDRSLDPQYRDFAPVMYYTVCSILDASPFATLRNRAMEIFSVDAVLEYIVDPETKISMLTTIAEHALFTLDFIFKLLKRSEELEFVHRDAVYTIITGAVGSITVEKTIELVIEMTKDRTFDMMKTALVEKMAIKYLVIKKVSSYLIDYLIDYMVATGRSCRNLSDDKKVKIAMIMRILERCSDDKNDTIFDRQLELLAPSKFFVVPGVDIALLDTLVTIGTDASFGAFCYGFRYTNISIDQDITTKLLPLVTTDDTKMNKFVESLKLRGAYGLKQGSYYILKKYVKEADMKNASPHFVDLVYTLFYIDVYLTGQVKLQKESEYWLPLPSDFSAQLVSADVFGLPELVRIYCSAENLTSVSLAKRILRMVIGPVASTYGSSALLLISGMFTEILQTDSEFIRAFELFTSLIGYSHPYLCMELSDIKGMFPLKAPSKKGKIKVTVRTKTESVDFWVYPSVLSIIIQAKVIRYFNTKKSDVTLTIDGSQLGPYTLEMYGIRSDCIMDVDISKPSERSDFFLIMESYNLASTSIAEKGLELLHRKEISDELAASILDFLNPMAPVSQIMVCSKDPRMLLQKIDESANCYEREVFLRSLLNFITYEDSFAESFAKTDGVRRIVATLLSIKPSKNEVCLIFDILLRSAITADLPIKDLGRSVIGTILSTKSRKCARLGCQLLQLIALVDPGFVEEHIVKNIMDFLKCPFPEGVIFIVDVLTDKRCIFDVLMKHMPDFAKDPVLCQPFFNILRSVCCDEGSETEVTMFLLDNWTPKAPDYLKNTICEYFTYVQCDDVKLDIPMLANMLKSTETCSSNAIAMIAREGASNPDSLTELVPLLSGFVDRMIVSRARKASMMMSNSPDPVGLQNLGATCYMNSIFQMLRCSPFGVSFLQETHLDEKWQIELQKIIAVMRSGKIHTLDAAEFCSLFKLSGKPIDVMEAQDAVEFLQAILSKLPDHCVSIFQGSVTSKFHGLSMPIKSETVEQCRTITLDVEGYSSLELSLRGFCQEEIIPSYKSEEAEKEIPVVHFSKISVCPEILTFHLKRTAYDLQTGTMKEIFNRFTFPVNLDMGPFCDEERDLSYTLTGVVLHKKLGRSSGHFHYIGLVPELNAWYDFNDSSVTAFDLSNLDKIAFGGDSQSECAYLLVYTKTALLQAPKSVTPPESNPNIASAIASVTLALQQRSVATSDAFFDLARQIQDPMFLYSYYKNVLIHLKNSDRCEIIRKQLTSLMIKNKLVRVIFDDIHANQITYKLIREIPSDEILQSWLSFIKTHILFLRDDAFDHMAHIVVALKRNLKPMLVDTLELWLAGKPENIARAATAGWHHVVVTALLTWYNNLDDFAKIYTVDFSFIFQFLKKFALWFDEIDLTNLTELSDFIVKSDLHVAAYYELMSELN